MDGEGEHRERLLREFLAEIDEPCPSCGYSLRGLTGSSCPECDEALVLRVGLQEPRLAAYLAGLIGLASGAGFHGFVFAWASWWIVFGAGGPQAGEMAALVVGLALCGYGLAMWIRYRGRIRRAPEAVRRGLVTACWVLSGATVVAFVSMAR